MAQLTTLLNFVKEREAIRLRKIDGQPPPWTKNKILQEYRFCNIRRSDDRVSRWLMQHVLKEEYIQANLANFLMFSAWCRWVNWPPTIQKVMAEGFFPAERIDWLKLGRFVDQLEGKKWTGAYMIVAPRGEGAPGKGVFVARDVISKSLCYAMPQLLTRLVEMNSLTRCEDIWTVLCTQKYFGAFMAGQVVGDWGYTSLLRDAPDRYTWAPIGPGSRRGFNRLLRRPLKTKVTQEEWQRKLSVWNTAIHYEFGYNLTALDVQNCLCELDKYLRVKNGEGRPRAKYRPETAYVV